MTELSPAAQAVVNAAVEAGGGYGKATPVLHARLAAALEAVTDQVVPETVTPWISSLTPLVSAGDVRRQLLVIAAELRGTITNQED